MSAETEPAERPWRDRDRLRGLYIDEDLDRQEVAAELGCSKSAVDDWLTRHGITKGPQRNWPDPETLERLYWEDNLSQREIAEHFDLSQGTIASAFDAHDIETRERQLKYSREELIEYLRSVNADCEYRVTSEDIKAADGPSDQTFTDRFGSWNDALEAADIDPDAPTRPTAYRDTLEVGQGNWLQSNHEVARELVDIDPPIRRHELDIDRAAFSKLYAIDLLQPASDRPISDPEVEGSYSWLWEPADGVREWIEHNVDLRGECPAADCDSRGVKNLGDEYTCTNDDCDSRFDRQTAREVLGR